MFGFGIQLFDTNTGGGGGSVTNALNGTHLNGTIVYLGGPLLESTGIDCNEFSFFIGAADAIVGNNFFSISAGFGEFGYQFFNAGIPTTESSYIQLLGDGAMGAMVRLQVESGNPSIFNQEIILSTLLGKGIQIGDTLDRIGLVQRNNGSTDAPFVPLQVLPGLQYLNEYNAFPAPLTGKFNASTLSVTTTLVDYVPVADTINQLAAYRVTAALFANLTGVGACHVRVSWVDQNFNPATFDFPGLVLTGDAVYTPMTLILAPGSNIKVELIVDAVGVNATVMGGIEFLNYIH